MFVIIGPKSCKTFIIRKILGLKSSEVSTFDIKCYKKHDNIIVDTPGSDIFDDYYELVQKAKTFSFKQITHVILFYTETVKYSKIELLYEQLNKEEVKLVIYDINNSHKYSNTPWNIIDYTQLRRLFLSKNDAKPRTEFFKYLFVGETNVGKSTFINNVLGEELIKTENKKYTTQETLMVQTKVEDKNIIIYDTYGLERQTKQKINAIDKLIKETDRVVIIVDIDNYSSRFNRFILREVLKRKKNVSVIVSKFDLINPENNNHNPAYITKYFNEININPLFCSIAVENILPKTIFTDVVNLKMVRVSKKNLTEDLKNKIKNIVYAKIMYTEDLKYQIDILIKITTRENKINELKLQKQIIKKYNLYNFYSDILIKKHIKPNA